MSRLSNKLVNSTSKDSMQLSIREPKNEESPNNEGNPHNTYALETDNLNNPYPLETEPSRGYGYLITTALVIKTFSYPHFTSLILF